MRKLILLLLFSTEVFAQPGSQNFDKVWVHGSYFVYTTTFDGSKPAVTRLTTPYFPYSLDLGSSCICDSLGNPILICNGFSLFNKDLNQIDSGQTLAPWRIRNYERGSSLILQSSIILPFANGKYRLVTPTVSDDSCYYNWERIGNGFHFDMLIYNELDITANGGTGLITRRTVPLLENVRLSLSQMMACRHGDGKSWWLFKQAADTNLVYKFLFTEDSVYGPYTQGFSGAATIDGEDFVGQTMFSKDGTKYATTSSGYGKVFVADFDRCSGMLSNPHVYDVPPQLTGNPAGPAEMDNTTNGLAFSPDGHYLYVCGEYSVQQLDLRNPVSPIAWTFLSGPDTSWQDFQHYSNIYPGPDGRLYIGNKYSGGGQMSVINFPNQYGVGAGFCPKCLRYPPFVYDTLNYYNVGSPPCMPYYGLGESNPICYPAGLQTVVSRQSQFSVCPNPSHGIIEVKSSGPGTLQLIDLTGRIIQTSNLKPAAGKNLINVTDLPAGVYQYRFIGNGGGTAMGKLVIQN